MMAQEDEHSPEDLQRLRSEFRELGDSLALAALGLRDDGMPASQELETRLAAARSRFQRVAEQARQEMTAASGVPFLDELRSLSQIEEVVRQIGVLREHREQETERQAALAIVNQALRVEHREPSKQEFLEGFFSCVRGAQRCLNDPQDPSQRQVAASLVSGQHPVAALLRLMADTTDVDELRLEAWQESAEQEFGKTVRTAAVHKRLVVAACAETAFSERAERTSAAAPLATEASGTEATISAAAAAPHAGERKASGPSGDVLLTVCKERQITSSESKRPEPQIAFESPPAAKPPESVVSTPPPNKGEERCDPQQELASRPLRRPGRIAELVSLEPMPQSVMDFVDKLHGGIQTKLEEHAPLTAAGSTVSGRASCARPLEPEPVPTGLSEPTQITNTPVEGDLASVAGAEPDSAPGSLSNLTVKAASEPVLFATPVSALKPDEEQRCRADWQQLRAFCRKGLYLQAALIAAACERQFGKRVHEGFEGPSFDALLFVHEALAERHQPQPPEWSYNAEALDEAPPESVRLVLLGALRCSFQFPLICQQLNDLLPKYLEHFHAFPRLDIWLRDAFSAAWIPGLWEQVTRPVIDPRPAWEDVWRKFRATYDESLHAAAGKASYARRQRQHMSRSPALKALNQAIRQVEHEAPVQHGPKVTPGGPAQSAQHGRMPTRDDESLIRPYLQRSPRPLIEEWIESTRRNKGNSVVQLSASQLAEVERTARDYLDLAQNAYNALLGHRKRKYEPDQSGEAFRLREKLRNTREDALAEARGTLWEPLLKHIMEHVFR